MLGFDEITMYRSIECNSVELLRCPFQVYEKNKFDFFRHYLLTEVDSSIIKQVDDGYFDFLQKVSEKCEFYNFSTLNNYTQNPRYYFEWSHYRPALGLIIEKYLFGTEEECSQIRKEAGDELFGVKVNSENADFVFSELKKQL